MCVHAHTHKIHDIHTQLPTEISTESSVFTGIPMNTSKIMSYKHGNYKQSYSLQLVRTKALKYMHTPVSLVAGFGN